MRIKSKVLLTLFAFLLFLVILAPNLIGWWMGEDSKNIATGLFQQRLGMEVAPENESLDFYSPGNAKIELDKNIQPFKQIGEKLGAPAKGNNAVLMRGLAIFDANNDGRLDLYFVHTGRPLAKKNNEQGVMDIDIPQDAKPNVLYLNMGNDEAGEPIYKTVPDLMAEKRDKNFVKEELMIENKYLPRSSFEEDPFGPGRIGFGAAAGDFNGDGLVDLLVLNHHFGMPHTVPGLGLKIYPPGENIGRGEKGFAYIETNIPPYYMGDMADGIHQQVDYGEKVEGEGRNTLYINKGDKDNDGIPEWEDATERVGMHLTNWASASATIGDIDRDGDLDIYISNFIDPDFWGFGIDRFGGHPNELWINQMAETGSLTFKEEALAYQVAGLHEEENLPSSMWDRKNGILFPISKQEYKGQQIGKKADHSWVSQLVDFNEDGFPDLVVANDIGNRLRVYENQKGKSFKILSQFNHPRWNGDWMGIASGDLDSDGREDIMVANFGTQSLLSRNTAIMATDEEDLSVATMNIHNYIDDKAVMHHALLSFDPEEGFIDQVKNTHLTHSPYIAPDAIRKSNWSKAALPLYDRFNFEHSIASLEFSWNPSFFDLDNDSDLDVYLVGSLGRGNDNFLGEFSAGVGRLLVNESSPGNFKFRDRTLEYRLLDIAHLDYEANPPSRPAPGTNWHKRDKIYLQDMDAYAEMGYETAKNSRVKDLFRMHESANGSVAADLNNDGFIDLVVAHSGGNNSNSPEARNLKVNFLGKEMAIPPPNKVIKAPTTFEEGPTFVYLNSGAPKEQQGSNWIMLNLRDDWSGNKNGIGAKVIVNDKIVRKHNLGGESYSGKLTPLHFGLGTEELKKVEVIWGSGDLLPQVFEFKKPLANQLVVIKRKRPTPIVIN